MHWNWQWDDKQSGGKPWPYDRADLRAGVICLGSYSRWTDESILRDGADPLRPIHAWMYQARYIDGVYNEDPDEWFATVAEAKAFVEAEADKMLAGVLPRGAAVDAKTSPTDINADLLVIEEHLHLVDHAKCLDKVRQLKGGEEKEMTL